MTKLERRKDKGKYLKRDISLNEKLSINQCYENVPLFYQLVKIN